MEIVNTLSLEILRICHLFFIPPSQSYHSSFQPIVGISLVISKESKPNAHSFALVTVFISSVQCSSVTQSCPTLCDPMNLSTPGLPVHHQLRESTQTHVHWISDAIQPLQPLSSPSPALSLSQHQGLSKWVSSSHQVAKVLEFQLQHQSYQWTPRTYKGHLVS